MKTFKWSRNYERCTECGTDEIAHKGGGVCSSCYDKRRYHKKAKPKVIKAWSNSHEACTVCGRTDMKHVSKGRCARCYQREKSRAQSANRQEAIRRHAAELVAEAVEPEAKPERFDSNGLRKGDLVKTHRFNSGEYERASGQIIDFVAVAGELFARVQRLQFPFGLDRWSVGKCTKFGHMEVAR